MRMSTSRSAARSTATVASRSSPTRTRATRSPPARCTAPPRAGPLESRMPPGGSGLPGSVSSSPVPMSDDARPAYDVRARDVQRREHAHLGRPEQRPGADDELAGADVLAGRAQVQPAADVAVDLDDVAVDHRLLLRDDGVRAAGHGRAGRDAYGGAGLDDHPCAGAGLRFADHAQARRPALGVRGDDRVTVHRRGVERRDVVGRRRVVGERTAERVVETDLLGVQHVGVLEHRGAGFVDRDGHALDGTSGHAPRAPGPTRRAMNRETSAIRDTL